MRPANTPLLRAAAITRRALPGLIVLLYAATAHAAPAPKTIAVFDFTLDNTSPAPSTPEELARTQRLAGTFSAALQHSGLYRPVDMSRAATLLHGQDPRGCNGCERPIAQELGASLAAYGWVQKVSNLILNINVVIEDVRTGRQVGGGSVDIRGNTDDSWNHGIKYLLEEHVLPQ
jgi:hypothetical protein